MEAKELRIGNLLGFEDGSIINVSGIHPYENHIHNGKQWLEIFRFNPIPLSEEWLLKAGFKKGKRGFFKYPLFYTKVDLKYKLRYRGTARIECDISKIYTLL